MVTVARMGDGRYAMAVEMCGAPGDYCRAHIKTSTDGLEWGSSAADLGSRPVSTTNHPFHGNPAIAWTPKGGPMGTLILSARDLQENLFTPDMRAGNHGQTLLVNHEYGEGPGMNSRPRFHGLRARTTRRRAIAILRFPRQR
ncbi:MAG: hypothetical protein R3A78_01650 [Polyangiales bacterium]